MRHKTLIIITMLAMMLSCTTKKQEEQKNNTEELDSIICEEVCIDKYNTIHLSFCSELEEKAKDISELAIKRLSVNDITLNMLDKTCVHCIRNAMYRKLKVKAMENDSTETNLDTAPKPIQKLKVIKTKTRF